MQLNFEIGLARIYSKTASSGLASVAYAPGSVTQGQGHGETGACFTNLISSLLQAASSNYT